MTDKELLQMAAKAAGYHYKPKNACIVVDGIPGVWNPLTDDGDALRLAVDCGIEVGAIGSANQVNCEARVGEIKIVQKINSAPYAATRRAIVRAAAEIGGNM